MRERVEWFRSISSKYLVCTVRAKLDNNTPTRVNRRCWTVWEEEHPSCPYFRYTHNWSAKRSSSSIEYSTTKSPKTNNNPFPSPTYNQPNKFPIPHFLLRLLPTKKKKKNAYLRFYTYSFPFTDFPSPPKPTSTPSQNHINPFLPFPQSLKFPAQALIKHKLHQSLKSPRCITPTCILTRKFFSISLFLKRFKKGDFFSSLKNGGYWYLLNGYELYVCTCTYRDGTEEKVL